jgi:hypothetical protein
MLRHSPRSIVVLAVVLASPPDLVAQYLDPGSGSVWLQILVGGVAGLAAVLKLYWGRIRGALRFGRRTGHGS